MMKHIDDLVENLYYELGGILFRNIDFIYEDNNVEIIELEPDNALLMKNISIRYGNKLVYIANNLDYISRRFVLLHELGHILLEHDLYNLSNPNIISKTEREANYFAFKMMRFKLNSEEILSYGIDKILDYIQNHQGTFTEEDYYEASCDL